MLHNKNSNKGFSMIELVVTIAIMSIVTAASVGIYQWISNSAFKEACNNITDSMAYARTEKLSKSGTWEVKIYLDSNNKCISEVENNSTSVRDVRNSKEVKIEAIDEYSSAIQLSSPETIVMEYGSNGSFKEAYITQGAGRTDIKGIKVTYSKYSKTIKLAQNTGKFFLE